MPRLYEEVSRLAAQESDYDFELFFVNDGSTDGTMDVIRQLAAADQRVGYADLSRNFGKENAMLAGIDHVTGHCTVIMDADLQHPPMLISKMLRLWEQGYDDVYARRQSRGKESFVRQCLTKLFYRILTWSSRYEVLENVGDFRLLDRKCIDALRQLRESERYTKGMYCWIGFRKAEVPFDTAERQEGTSKWSFPALLNLAVEGITSFTTIPLRIASVVGIVVALCALLYMVWVMVKAIIWGDPVTGFPTIMSVMLFLGAIQLIAIGILGEYVGRIYNETKRRPVYMIRELKVNDLLSQSKSVKETQQQSAATTPLPQDGLPQSPDCR